MIQHFQKNHIKYLFIPNKISYSNFFQVIDVLYGGKLLSSFIKRYSLKKDFPSSFNKCYPKLSGERSLCDPIRFSEDNANLILSSYFSNKKDPQRNINQSNNNFKYFKVWYSSIIKLNLNGIIFHDCLSESFVMKYKNENIQFCKVVLGDMSLNDERFFIYKEFMHKYSQYIGNIILTDISDVEFINNPFTFIKNEKIYFGIDNAINFVESKGMLNKLSQFLNSSNFEIKKDFLFQPIINAGVIGGSKNQVKFLVNEICKCLNQCQDDQNHNMVALNYVLYKNKLFPFKLKYIAINKPSETLVNNKVHAGKPFVSKFKEYDTSKFNFIRHK